MNKRVEFLEQAIANNWFLSEVRQRISEKICPASNPNTELDNYKERFTAATTKLRKSAMNRVRRSFTPRIPRNIAPGFGWYSVSIATSPGDVHNPGFMLTFGGRLALSDSTKFDISRLEC